MIYITLIATAILDRLSNHQFSFKTFKRKILSKTLLIALLKTMLLNPRALRKLYLKLTFMTLNRVPELKLKMSQSQPLDAQIIPKIIGESLSLSPLSD
jgi:hypothetical protein